jgi:transcriptional regulator with XRE-family HTH domain
MARRRRTNLEAEAARQLQSSLVREGAKIRRARKRRGWTQAQLGRKVGLAQSTISQMERGEGGTLALETWQRVALVLGLPLSIELGRDAHEEPADAGHLGIQELVLRLGRESGYLRTFELPTRPADPARSTDVGLTDDSQRRLTLIECVNTFGNIGAAARSSDRKRAEAEALAISIGRGQPYTVHACWVVKASRRNREIVGRYPELFESRFPGSSRGWVGALARGSAPPDGLGLVWCTVSATRIFEWRRHPQ